MTSEHDDATDARPTTAADEPTSSDADRRPADETGPSPAQVGALALALLVALGAVLAAAPAAAGVAAASSGSPHAVGPSGSPLAGAAAAGAPVAIEAPGPVGPPDRSSISGGFSRATYTAVAGDPIEIRHTAKNPDGAAYLLVGGNRLSDTGQSVGYVDVIKITGQATTINTRTIGTNQTNVRSCAREDVSCDLTFRNADGDVTATSLANVSGFAGATAADGLARPLVPQRYRLAITNGTFVVDDSGIVQPTEVAAQADLVLEKPAFRDDIEVFTSIDPAALDGDGNGDTESLAALRANGLDRTAVTKGNRIVLGFEATGIWGALSHFAAERDAGPLEAGQTVDHRVLRDLLTADEGMSLHVRQTNPGINEPASRLELSRADPEDVTLLIADATELETPDAPGRFYLVIDTSDGDHFTQPPEPGDEFEVAFAFEGTAGERYAFDGGGTGPPAAFEPAGDAAQFPYWETGDETVRATATFSVRERYLRYDHVTDDGEILVEAEDGRVTGTTSLLPVREMSATFVNDASGAPFRSEAPLEIADGNFTIDVGLDGEGPGTRLNYELYEGTTLRDSRTVVVVGDADNPDELVIADAPRNVTVTEGGNLSAIRVTARNAGGIRGEGDLRLAVDNGTVAGSWGVRLGPNESRSFDFGATTADLEPGTYPFSLRLDGDVHNGTVVVENDPATTTIDDDDPAPQDGNGTADGGADGDGTTDGAASDDAADGGESTDGSASDDGSMSDDGDGSDGESAADGTDDAPPEEPADDGSRSSGLIPFPFGTREALGGTVLVGAVHLLGHWV